MAKVTLADVVKVRGRFQRSVHLIRDWSAQRGLKDYLLTPTAHQITQQILEGVGQNGGGRTWSITGPYGTGKSAFALFLTDLLVNDPPKHPKGKRLQSELLNGNHSFLPVLVVGERAAMAPAFLKALSKGLKDDVPSLARKAARAAKNGRLSNGEVVDLFEQAAQIANRVGRGGILFVVDEFGKFLEFAATHPELEDLLILQDLAEAASRSEAPIVFLTILHSAFAEYLDVVDGTRRLEWQKVHGRFADVAFIEPPEQFVHLIGEAIEWKASTGRKRRYENAVETLATSSSLEEARRRFPIKDLLPRCVPLHPVTALLLSPLFRSKLSQNERSLFAFLNDRGPFGFQEFLALGGAERTGVSLYSLDRLYDYVRATLDTGMFLGDRAHRWAEIEHAIDRVDAVAPPRSKSVVKCIGLLGLYGRSVGLRASKPILKLALEDQNAVAEALKHLENTSIVVYRRYEDAYSLWEGSDVDLEASFKEALNHVERGNLAHRLKRAVNLRPIVARAHYIQTGTLRYFEVDVIDGEERGMQEALHEDPENSNGKLVFVLSRKEGERLSLIEFAQQMTKTEEPSLQLRIFGFPKPFAGLEAALQEVEAWNWVSENISELQGDPVARKEVAERMKQTRQRLENVSGTVLGLRGYPFDPESSNWVQGGSLHELGSTIDFTKWISVICDEVFCEAPPLNNELINRENLSSAAASARRNLIEAMLTREHEPQLGIQGNPAEVTMYKALLQAGGFHRKRTGQLMFGLPMKEWRPVWRAIKGFLRTTRTGRRPLVELIANLKDAPFGLRDGPVPVILCALFLAHRDQIALYEDGVFVPEPRIEMFERLMRAPSAFEIQLYQLNKGDREAFEAIGAILGELELLDGDQVGDKLLDVVKPLVIFAAHLPAFTKRTNHIEPDQAVRVREALLRARDPYILLYEELPDAIGISIKDKSGITKFTDNIRACLLGLQRAYPSLLDNIELQLREAFDLVGNSTSAREKLRSRAEPLAGYAVDPSLALFVREACRLDDSRDWRQSIARAVSQGRPPTNWTDADAVQFRAHLRHIASGFVRLEELIAEQHRSKTGTILRIGLLDGKFEEARAVVATPTGRELEVNELAEKIIRTLEDGMDEGKEGERIRLAALARAVEKYLRDKGV